MLETPPMDVNTAAGESSTPVAETPAQEPSLAEALNTESAPKAEEHEKYVPYDRFQEVVKARQELEEKLKSPDWDGFQKLNSAVQNDPALGNVLMEAVANHYRQLNQQLGQQPLQQQPQNPADPVQQMQSVLQAQEQQLQYLMAQQQQATYQRYSSEFENKASAAKVSEHWKPVYENAVRQLVGGMNPNALMQYDPNLISKAFDQVHQQVQALQRAERTAYVADKTKDNMPPSTSGAGATPRVVSGDNTAEARKAELLELLMAQQ